MTLNFILSNEENQAELYTEQPACLLHNHEQCGGNRGC